MTLNFKKFLLMTLVMSILLLSSGYVSAFSDEEILTNSSLENSISGPDFVVDYDENIGGEIIIENKCAANNSVDLKSPDTKFENEYLFNDVNDMGRDSESDLKSITPIKGNLNSNKMNTIIHAQNMEKFYDDCDKRFKMALISQENEKLSNKQVIFQIIFSNGTTKNYTKTTNDLGEAFLNINLIPNAYHICSIFEGDSSFSPSSRTNSIQINKSKTYLFSSDMIALKNTPNKKFQVKITDSNFVPLVNKTVIIRVNNVSYTRTSDSSGIATLNVNLQYYGTYSFNASFSSDARYLASKSSNKVQIASNVFSDEEIFSASKTVKEYVEKNHKLPSTVNIGSVKLNMAQYFVLASELIINPNQTVAPLLKSTYQNAPSPSENTSGGILNSTEYMKIFTRMSEFTYKNDKTPNYDVSSLEKVSVNSYIYLASSILYSRSINLNNPYFITLIPWKDITNANTKFFNQYDVLDASKMLKNYIEKNHKLPNTISVNGTSVKMAPFFKMVSTTIIDIEGDYFSSIPYKNYDAAPNPKETINCNFLSEDKYLIYAVDVNHFMDIMGYAPNWVSTDFGNIRFENSLYSFSQILSYYYEIDFMPDKIVVYPWATVIKDTTKVYTNSEIINSAVSLKNYIIQNHKVPNKVSLAGKDINIEVFLQLASETVLNIDYDLYSNSIAKSITAVDSSGTESIKNIYLSRDNYIKLINSLNDYLLKNKKSPSKLTLNLTYDKEGMINSSNVVVSKNSLVYLLSDILSSYNSVKMLPEKIEFYSWADLTESNSLIFSKEEIKNSASQLINQIDSNHNMPNSINISNNQVNRIDFLDLLINTVYKLDNNYISSSLIRNLANNDFGDENLISGSFDYSEYMKILSDIRFNITKSEFNGADSSLGHLGVNSLIYMYSKILVDYANSSLQENYVLTPWIAKTNPNKIYNYNSLKVFSNLNEAISDSENKDGDTIGIGIAINNIGTISLNKSLNLIPVPEVDVSLVNSSQNSKVVFTDASSGSYIADLNILNVELYLNNASNICIYYSNITNYLKTSINIYNSADNEIIGNNIYNSNIGILLDQNSKDNKISNNIIHDNIYGIKVNSCVNDSIEGNIIENNDYGIYAQNSSFDLEFNSISNNNQELFDSGVKSSNLNNNWWGTNNPKISATNTNEKIYSKKNSNIKYLILTLESYNYFEKGTDNDYLRLLKASFKNNENDNIDLESFPLIPIHFETNKGSINQSNYMISGIGTAVLGGSLNTSSNIELTVSNQVISLPISFNKFNNPVINSRNNKTFKTIQGAIDDVNTRDGDTLKLKAGVYLENVCIFKKISLVSFGDGEVLIIPKNESISSTVIVSNDNVSLKNLSIYGTVSTNAVFSTGNSFSLINSKIFNSFAGVYLYSTNNACLLNNSISGCSYALYLDGSDNGSFINNTIFNNDYGFLAKYSNINLFKTNALFNNWIGVEDSSKYNQFVSNDIHDNYQGIRLIASSSALLENTSVYGNYIGLLRYGSSFMNKSSDVYNNSLVNVQSLSDGDIIIQENMWYCGPAALSIIFENLGLTASQKDIANIAGTNTNGTSLYGLYLSCLSYGFNSTVWKLSSSDLRINDLIVLLFDGEYHFSVVYDINESAVVLNDPSIGLFELSRETFDELFSGYVLDVEPVKDRGVKVSVTQMKSVVGTNPLVIAGLVLDPVVLLGGAVVMAAAWTGWQIGAYAGELYNSWRKHNKSPSYKKRVTQYKNPNGHYYVSYPTYGGNKGNRVKAISPSSVSYSFGNAKYYVKGHGYLSKSSLNKLGISSTQLAEIAYQESYNYYLKTKNKERLKVGEPSEFSIICRERELYKHLNAAGDGGNITKQHSLDNILTYARNLPEFSTRTSSKGTELIRLGIKNSSPKLVAKGIRYISISVISSAGFASVMVKYSPFISIIVISKLSD